MDYDMKNESERLKENIKKTYGRFSRITEKKASVNLSKDKWSLKEIFGHLVDSAANNYQRFIRLQETDGLDFPGYGYDWIHMIPYETYPYKQILRLWEQFNLLICHIIENIDETRLGNRWMIDGNQLTLGFVVKDYNDHMETHLEQLEQRLVEVNASAFVITYRAVKSYDEAPDSPIRLSSGETVSVVEESDPAGDWPNWILCRCQCKEGWVPKQIIDVSGDAGIVRENYDATEFNLAPGDVIVAEKELNGWVWGTKQIEPDRYGWAPLNCLERVE